MQEVYTALPIGTIVRGQYVVEDVLHRGEFSSVYLVKDRRDGEHVFLLKEVSSSATKDQHFASLKKLHHPALPRIYNVFNDVDQTRTYILMDYIEGPSLEELQQEQPEHRFSLPQIMTLIAPIIDAAMYLHNQQPPVIHQNIQPSNIIISKSNNRIVLVGFGIAQEYVADTASTTVQHDVSAYASPEQYSNSQRISPRTDIYALGATLYTLCTGITPPDALSRLTKLGQKEPDPLVPMNEITPTIPATIATTVQRAMSISSYERFPTAEQLWEALWLMPNATTTPWMQQIAEPVITDQTTENTESNANLITQELPEPALENLGSESEESNASSTAQQPPDSIAERVAPLHPPVITEKEVTTPIPVALQEQQRNYRFKKPRLLPLILLVLAILLISIGVVASTWFYTAGHHSTSSTPPTLTRQHKAILPDATATPNSTVTSTPTPIATPYPAISQSYSGTIHDIPTGVTATISLTGIYQQQGNISGYFGGMPKNNLFNGIPQNGSFQGTINPTKHVQFIMTSATGQATFSFDGLILPDNSIGGTYCSLDVVPGKCSNYGVWSLTPTAS